MFIKKLAKAKLSPNLPLFHSQLALARSHLRQHGVLPPPGHADTQQVVHRGGVLQAGLPRLLLVGRPAEDGVSAGL